MSDDPAGWLVPAGAFALVLFYLVTRRFAEGKRCRHFATLAAHCGATLEESRARFTLTVDDHAVEVRDELRPGGPGSNGVGSRYLTTATKLRGRSWDLHSVIISGRLSARPDHSFERRFKVEDLGFPMPPHWVTAEVRSGVESLFAVGIASAKIEIDAGELLHRALASPTELTPQTLDLVLDRQIALARAIERAR